MSFSWVMRGTAPIKCQISRICPTPSPSWGGASPTRHPRGPPQSPKATKNTTEITKFGLAVFLVGKEGNSPLKTIKCIVFLICPTPLPSWGGASPIRHPRGPSQSTRATNNTTKITRFGLAVFLVGKEGNSPLKTIKYKVFLICPLTPSPS